MMSCDWAESQGNSVILLIGERVMTVPIELNLTNFLENLPGNNIQYHSELSIYKKLVVVQLCRQGHLSSPVPCYCQCQEEQ